MIPFNAAVNTEYCLVFGSRTDPILLLILLSFSLCYCLQKSLKLCRFKSDQDEMSSSKCASNQLTESDFSHDVILWRWQPAISSAYRSWFV